MHYAFSKKSRLQTAKDYQAVFATGRRFSSQHAAMLANPNQLHYGRLGLIVSKKQIRTAVARNCIKRIVRESFRLKQHELKGFDVIIIAYKSLASLNKIELHTCISKQWSRLLMQQKIA